MKTLYAHGKLQISAEYMVMYGSKALALPLQLGQSMQRIRSENPNLFSWKAYHRDKTWFSALMNPSNLRILESTDPEKAEYLQQLIMACIQMVPSFQENLFKFDVETVLDFSPQWGLGSSSTLTAMMAEWAEVNPLDLHFMISEGSGLDIACALAEGPIIYRLRDDEPHYQHVLFQPPFIHQIYFARLESVPSRAESLQQAMEKWHPDFVTIHHFSELTDRMLEAMELSSFQKCMEEHEGALSELLGMKMISDTLFPGLPGSVKSLGWWRDFVMIASEAPEKELYDYLHEKDIKIIYSYQELVYDERNDEVIP